MEYIERDCSFESELSFDSIYSIRILNILEVIARKLENAQPCLSFDTLDSNWIRDCFNWDFSSLFSTIHDSSHWPVKVRRSKTAARALFFGFAIFDKSQFFREYLKFWKEF